MLKVGEDGDLSNYIPNNEWTLVKLHVIRNVVYYSCCAEPYPDVTYTIQIRRKPLFYVFNMILPCLLITLVAMLGFYIPSDSGEKVTIGITTLLSMTVFLMLVTESMPPTSDVLPLIGEWMVCGALYEEKKRDVCSFVRPFVRPSVRSSVRSFVRPSVRPSVRTYARGSHSTSNIPYQLVFP